MTKKETLWEDSGFDCHHCGGEIYKRIEREPGFDKTTSYQCRQCHCQWSTEGVLIQVGDTADCRAGVGQTAVNQPTSTTKPQPSTTLAPLKQPAAPSKRHTFSNWLIGGLLGLIIVLALIRFAGALVFRFFIPALLVGVILYLVFQLGRQQRWW
ncbi:MAG: hypothetical protein KDE56_17705 [Anaerolineales bacterium]|nr:hypothetical protein [Anaerolineales bacterium]